MFKKIMVFPLSLSLLLSVAITDAADRRRGEGMREERSMREDASGRESLRAESDETSEGMGAREELRGGERRRDGGHRGRYHGGHRRGWLSPRATVVVRGDRPCEFPGDCDCVTWYGRWVPCGPRFYRPRVRSSIWLGVGGGWGYGSWRGHRGWGRRGRWGHHGHRSHHGGHHGGHHR